MGWRTTTAMEEMAQNAGFGWTGKEQSKEGDCEGAHDHSR
jgi:hypothetical protein